MANGCCGPGSLGKARPFDVFVIPFSLMWTGFVVFWVYKVITSGAPLFFMLWGVPFMLFGLYLLFGRFIIDAKRRERTFYGVTDQRIIIISRWLSRRVETLTLRTLSDLSLREKRDKSGTITFGPSHPMSWMWYWCSFPPCCGMGHPTAFEMIENAKDVYNLIRDAQQAV